MMIKAEKMTRERYVDIAKGIAILCIALLHYENGIFPQQLNTFIGSFMVSMFYVASGWISALYPKQLGFKDFLRKRWRQLGKPYLWWTGIILGFDSILWLLGYYDAYFMGREVYKSVVLRGIGTLWFLPALFGGEIIWFWLKQQNRLLLLLVFALTVGYRYLYYRIFAVHEELMWRILDAPFQAFNNMLTAWVGIAFGYYTCKLLGKFMCEVKGIFLFILGLLLFSSAYYMANYLPSFLSVLGFCFAPLFGPLGLLLMAKPIQNARWLDFFNYWGINSLSLMVTHYSVVLVVFQILVEKTLHEPFSGWITLLCFVVSMPIQYGITELINTRARFLLGK